MPAALVDEQADAEIAEEGGGSEGEAEGFEEPAWINDLGRVARGAARRRGLLAIAVLGAVGSW